MAMLGRISQPPDSDPGQPTQQTVWLLSVTGVDVQRPTQSVYWDIYPLVMTNIAMV